MNTQWHVHTDTLRHTHTFFRWVFEGWLVRSFLLEAAIRFWKCVVTGNTICVLSVVFLANVNHQEGKMQHPAHNGIMQIKAHYACDPEKAVEPHSSTFAWKIPWMEEPGRLQSMGSLRVGHNRATSLSLFTFMHWRGQWQPTPVFLPGESQGQGSLVGCRLWGHTESDMTEAT